jgi:type I restriction enzyme S subunit
MQTLELIDAKIDTNNALSKLLEEIAQTIFKSWFIDFEPVKAKMAGKKPTGMDAATAALFPDSMEESEIGLIPKGWQPVRLENHIKVTKGKSYKSSELEASKTALVTLKSFKRGGGYRFDGLKPFSGEYKSEQVVEPGDLIVSFTDVTQAADVIGKPAIVMPNPVFSTLVASLDVGIVRTVRNSLGKNYLYQLFSTPIFKNHIDGYTNGTTVLHLGKGALEDFIVTLPAEILMEKWESFATSVNNKLQSLYLESLILAEMRDSLLPRLISGELQIPDEMLAS